MSIETFNYSAPGSIMLMGEHAVLRGHPCVVASISARANVMLTPRNNDSIHLQTALGNHQTDRHTLEPHARLDYLMAIIQTYQTRLQTGFDLAVQSEIDHRIGLGSSAAIVVAAHACLIHWLTGQRPAPDELHAICLKTVHALKSHGSGADLAASIHGGCLCYQAQPSHVEKLCESSTHLPRIAMVYTGHKTPTPTVIEQVAKRFQSRPEALQAIDQGIAKVVKNSLAHWRQGEWEPLGAAFNTHQSWHAQLGVSTPALDDAIAVLNDHPNILGAKISGSGMGDCAIGLLHHTEPHTARDLHCQPPLQAMPIALGLEGLKQHHPTQSPLWIERSLDPCTLQAEVCKQILGDRNRQPVQQSAQAFAPSNIALIKYWGKRDDALNLPMTSSLSISLGHLGATASFQQRRGSFTITHNDQPVEMKSALAQGILRTFARLGLTPKDLQLSISMNLPMAAGLASSACGHASIVMALNALYGWHLDQTKLSMLARMGSGSASRSLWQGFVLWQRGEDPMGMDSHGLPLATHWPALRVGVMMVSTHEKPISSRRAMQITRDTSQRYASWPAQVAEDLAGIQDAIASKDFHTMGQIMEANAISMHATMLDANPAIQYSLPSTWAIIEQVKALRASDIPCYYTQDAGPNIKILFLEDDLEAIQKEFPEMLVAQPF